MKKKKDFNYALYILLPVVLIIIIFLGIKNYREEYSFNPDEDVCLEEGMICNGIKLGVMCSERHIIGCEEFRPKTECELNPNSENCICDESEEVCMKGYEISCVIFNSLPEINCSNARNQTQCEIMKSYEIAMNPFYETCIKSHLPNECEKGNEDYIEENITYNLLSCEKEPCIFADGWEAPKEHTPNIIIKTNSTICRLKTLEDYSCKELKRELILWTSLPYIKKDPECMESLFFRACEKYNKNEIYDIAIERGCDI